MYSVGLLVLYMEHFWHRWTENVGVQQPYLVAETCQCYGEIGRDGALADTAFAAADGDDVLHARQQLLHLRARGRLELGFDGDFYILTAMVLDSSLGRLDR